MTPSDVSSIDAAAQWLVDQKEPPALAVPVLKEKFALNALQACEAIRLAQSLRTSRKALG